jgi:5-methylcytosine-specific restriction endonuclease McrA
LEWFGPNPRAYRGLHGKCIPCRSYERLEDQRRNPEKHNAKVRNWLRDNRDRAHEIARKHRSGVDEYTRRLPGGKARAVKLGLPAETITVEELFVDFARRGIDPARDAYTGEPLEDGWHLDHIHPLSNPASPGHVVWNLVPVNQATNNKKWTKTLVDFLADRAVAARKEEVA